LAPAEQKGTPFGYSPSFDLLCIQEAIDILYSTVVTNQSSFGVQNVLLPNGSNISVSQLVDGLNALFYDPKFPKPEALNLTNTPAEIFNMIDKLERVMETLSGINSVTRGDPEASLKSGAALALVQSMAIQFNSGLQKAYARQVENIGTAVVKILAKFPKTKRIVEIAGKANRTYLKEFSAADLAGISRVTVDLGNPLSRTTAGKVQMAEDLLSNKLIETGDQYIQVLTTGTLEPLIEGKQAELMLIASENDMMSEGKKPVVAVTDDHALHIREHKVVLASPEARENPGAVTALTEHETEHIRMLEQLSVKNPNLLIALGQTPVQPPAPQLPPPGAPPAGGPGGGGGAPSKMLDATPAVVKAATGVKGPAMPKNALTGEPAPAPLPPSAA
jgi:carbon monoxide dehydrogenase subunit G